MGIIVLAVAILPMLGIGGMQLYRAESPGPVKDNKLTPQNHRNCQGTVVSVSRHHPGVHAFSYWVAGMTPFDAHLPQLLHGRYRRLLHPRCKPRLLRQSRGRGW